MAVGATLEGHEGHGYTVASGPLAETRAEKVEANMTALLTIIEDLIVKAEVVQGGEIIIANVKARRMSVICQVDSIKV